ncbi:MAG: hypothetical protein ABII80_04010 [bacterium]
MTEQDWLTNAILLVEQNLSPDDAGLQPFIDYLEFLRKLDQNPTQELLVAKEAIETALCSSFCLKEMRYMALHNRITQSLESGNDYGSL